MSGEEGGGKRLRLVFTLFLSSKSWQQEKERKKRIFQILKNTEGKKEDEIMNE